jgi:Tol biopolymer transport system component
VQAARSDVFVTRVGGRPRLLAGQARGAAWNFCPIFSPNGRMLAFVRETSAGSAIVVVRVGHDSPAGAGRIALRVPWGSPRCPRWSSNSSRLAYRIGRRVVVRGLDGSKLHRAAGDPTIHDFDRSRRQLVSPTGDLVTRMADGGIVVSRPDGSDRRLINDDPPSYAIAGWCRMGPSSS